MKIVTNSEYEIFNEYSPEGQLIKKSTFICNKTEEKTNKSIEQIIEMLKKNKNYSMLEFAWYPVFIRPVKGDYLDNILRILKRFEKEKYLNCNNLKDGVLISGSGRAWYECLKEDKNTNTLVRSIYNFLNKLNPSLFDTHDVFSSDEFYIKLLTKEEIQLCEKTLNSEPIINDNNIREKHDWFAVAFYGVSGSFISEILQHRTMSFATKSNRYVTAKDFSFLIEDGALINNSVDKQKLEECLEKIQLTYNYFLNRGHKRDVVRQLLPIGFTNDIVVAGTIECWKHLFELQTNSESHWEIRTILNDLKRELNEKYNYSFKE